ncbi:MAG: fibronectin type III domain-containing protein, partial [Chitinispirillaceae bacterium]|nr:fibronectin type III domain-containing protein [Chitinispirillaceae bacterium]
MKHAKLPAIKTTLALLCLISLAFSLEAPYLISATALSDSSISLAWRNNDAATEGFIVQRRDSTQTDYAIIDSITPATQLTYIDSNGLLPETHYIYQIRAYNQSEVSDTSNNLGATTLNLAPLLVPPRVDASWDYDTSRSVIIRIKDSSNCEIGYRVFREDSFSGAYDELAWFPSTKPKARDSFFLLDTGISLNKWYVYKVIGIHGSDTVTSICTTYTFRSIQAEQTVIFEKVGEFPVAMTDGWSVKVGDSIILKEDPSPEGSFTILNIADPTNPKFDGYTDSATLLTYPPETLIPAYLRFGKWNKYGISNVTTRNGNIVIANYPNLELYQIQGNTMELVDTVSRFEWFEGDGVGFFLLNVWFLNDSMILLNSMSSIGTSHFTHTYYFLTVKIQQAKFSKILSYNTGSGSSDGGPHIDYFLGFHADEFIISAQRLYFLSPPPIERIIFHNILSN